MGFMRDIVCAGTRVRIDRCATRIPERTGDDSFCRTGALIGTFLMRRGGHQRL